MVQNNYKGFDKVVKDALVENRGKTLIISKEGKILELERRLEQEKLTHTEMAEIRKQLKKIRTT